MNTYGIYSFHVPIIHNSFRTVVLNEVLLTLRDKTSGHSVELTLFHKE